jgi:chromate transporter
MSITMQWSDWLAFFQHFLSLSLLCVGGVITTTPEIHRYLVDEQHWLSAEQFNQSIALAQGAPGPNVLFVALMGWYVGLNAASAGTLDASSIQTALWAAFFAMVGILLPCSVLTYFATHWLYTQRERLTVRAFKSGMAPVVVGLLISTGWLLAQNQQLTHPGWPLAALALLSAVAVWKTKLHLMILLGLGALAGAMGWV